MRKAIFTLLTLTVAALGCTTNQYAGNGQPASEMTNGQANQSNTYGSSSGNAGVPPMASSCTGVSRPNTDALATLAGDEGFRGRVLGTINPTETTPAVPTPAQPTGQVVLPAMIVNPQPTVNPSVSSPTGVPAYTNGASVVADEAQFLNAVGSIGATASVPAATTGESLAVLGATGVGAPPPTGAVIPATTATSRISGKAAFAPSAMNGVVAGTTGRMTAKSSMTVNNTKAATPKATSTMARAVTASSKSSGSVNARLSTAPLLVSTSSKGQIVVTNVSSPSTKGTIAVKP